MLPTEMSYLLYAPHRDVGGHFSQTKWEAVEILINTDWNANKR